MKAFADGVDGLLELLEETKSADEAWLQRQKRGRDESVDADKDSPSSKRSRHLTEVGPGSEVP